MKLCKCPSSGFPYFTGEPKGQCEVLSVKFEAASCLSTEVGGVKVRVKPERFLNSFAFFVSPFSCFLVLHPLCLILHFSVVLYIFAFCLGLLPVNSAFGLLCAAITYCYVCNATVPLLQSDARSLSELLLLPLKYKIQLYVMR